MCCVVTVIESSGFEVVFCGLIGTIKSYEILDSCFDEACSNLLRAKPECSVVYAHGVVDAP